MSNGTTDGNSRLPRVLLNVAAVLIVAVWLLYPRGVGPDLVGVIVGLVALAAWAGWAIAAAGGTRTALLIIGAVAGAVAVEGTDALLISAVIASVISFVATPTIRLWGVVSLVAVIAVVLGVGSLIGHRDLPFLLSVFGGLVLAVLVGVTRRQSRLADARERELLARTLEAERESARAALLADRAAVARDIHDVLAHSLGGLVIQLDAVGALLDAGQLDGAAQRVAQAHQLAIDGLADARRAVGALREEGATSIAALGTPDPTDDTSLADLVATHRSLGFAAVVEGDLDLSGVDSAQRTALVRAVQEALSNARRHAPQSVAIIRSSAADSRMVVSIVTALPDSALPDTVLPDSVIAGTAQNEPEHGHGLIGMTERFAHLGDGSTVFAGRRGGDFVVEASVPRAGAS